MVLLRPFLGHGIGRVRSADIPGKGLRRIRVQIRRVVRESAAVQRITEHADLAPQLQ